MVEKDGSPLSTAKWTLRPALATMSAQIAITNLIAASEPIQRTNRLCTTCGKHALEPVLGGRFWIAPLFCVAPPGTQHPAAPTHNRPRGPLRPDQTRRLDRSRAS